MHKSNFSLFFRLVYVVRGCLRGVPMGVSFPPPLRGSSHCEAGQFCHPHGTQKSRNDPPHGAQNGHYGRVGVRPPPPLRGSSPYEAGQFCHPHGEQKRRYVPHRIYLIPTNFLLPPKCPRFPRHEKEAGASRDSAPAPASPFRHGTSVQFPATITFLPPTT